MLKGVLADLSLKTALIRLFFLFSYAPLQRTEKRKVRSKNNKNKGPKNEVTQKRMPRQGNYTILTQKRRTRRSLSSAQVLRLVSLN